MTFGKVGNTSPDTAGNSPQVADFESRRTSLYDFTHHTPQLTMTPSAIVSRISRTGKSATSLALGLRNLTISPAASRSAPQTRLVCRRNVWTATRPWQNIPIFLKARPTVTKCVGTLQQQQQQSRGMKVHSSIKKRCEYCKVGVNQLDSCRIVSWPIGSFTWG